MGCQGDRSPVQLTSSIVQSQSSHSNGCESSSSSSVSPSGGRCWRLRRCRPAADQPEKLPRRLHIRDILCFLSV
ncbi:unnamed protein product [Urochloa humidicola]